MLGVLFRTLLMLFLLFPNFRNLCQHGGFEIQGHWMTFFEHSCTLSQLTTLKLHIRNRTYSDLRNGLNLLHFMKVSTRDSTPMVVDLSSTLKIGFRYISLTLNFRSLFVRTRARDVFVHIR